MVYGSPQSSRLRCIKSDSFIPKLGKKPSPTNGSHCIESEFKIKPDNPDDKLSRTGEFLRHWSSRNNKITFLRVIYCNM